MKRKIEHILSAVRRDCIHFDASKPCAPHKSKGVFCDDCAYYELKEFTIVILKFGSIGDVLRTTSILPALKLEYPHSYIVWVTAPNAASMFSGNPHVNKVLSDTAEYLPFLQTVHFDLLINLETDIKSSALATVTNADERRGYYLNENGEVLFSNPGAAEWYAMGIHDGVKKENTQTYFYHILNVAGLKDNGERPEIYLSEKELERCEVFSRDNRFGRFRKILGINTGSGGRWPLKKWTMENHCEFISFMLATHPDIGIVLFGGPEEEAYNTKIMEIFQGKIVDAGTANPMREFFARLHSVDVLLTPDSLALHAGVGLGKPVVVYTGPTSYAELDVFGKGEILHADLDCLVCYLNSCAKEINCMNTLSVDRVYSSVKKYLE